MYLLPPRQSEPAQPLHRLLGRRLLLSRRRGPRGDPDDDPPRLGRRARPRAPGSRSSATTTSAAALASDDKIISALPDWRGRIWFASEQGRGRRDRAARAAPCRRVDTDEPIGNSFAVDETGGVYIVTDKALYRLRRATGTAARGELAAHLPQHPASQARPDRGRLGHDADAAWATTTSRSPTTPTRCTSLVYRRGRRTRGRAGLRVPVFTQGAGATDHSLIGTGRSMVVENNYGYSGPTSATRAARHDARASSASTSTRTASGCHDACGAATSRALGRAQALARQRARLHVYEGRRGSTTTPGT